MLYNGLAAYYTAERQNMYEYPCVSGPVDNGVVVVLQRLGEQARRWNLDTPVK